MVHCVAIDCNNKNEKKKNVKGLHFHAFPKDKKLRDTWIKLLKRKDYEWRSTHRICSEHFDKCHYDVDPEWMASYGYANARPKLKVTAVPRFSFPTATVTTLTVTPTRGGYIKRRKIEVIIID